MEITEVRIKLMESTEDRLRGFCSVTIDSCFVVRDLKIIEGQNGPFVAMPSRKLTGNCSNCRTKNHLRARYCNQCGKRLQSATIEHDQGGRAKLYADIAHPINSTCREMIQNSVIAELNRELELARQPGYRSRYDEMYFDSGDFEDDEAAEPAPSGSSAEPEKSRKPSESTATNGHHKRVDAPAEQSSVTGTHVRPDTAKAGREPDEEDTFGQGIL